MPGHGLGDAVLAAAGAAHPHRWGILFGGGGRGWRCKMGQGDHEGLMAAVQPTACTGGAWGTPKWEL